MLGDALCDFTRRTEGGGGGGGGEGRQKEEEGRQRCCRAVLLFRRLPSLSLRAFGQHPAGGMEPAGGYGAGKAGGVAFDPVAFFTHPRTVLRLMSWVSLPNPLFRPRNVPGADRGWASSSSIQLPNLTASAKITDVYLFICFNLSVLRQGELSELRCKVPGGRTRRQTAALLCSLWLELRRLISMC